MIVNKVYKKFKELGFFCSLLCFQKRIQLRYLCWKYNFDKWHATAPYECRPYKWEAVSLSNTITPESVLEVGCGLGDIVSRIEAKEKFGCDLDDNALFIANKLCEDTKFFYSSLEDDTKIFNNISLKNLDLIVLINWPHLMPWKEIKNCVENLKEKINIKYLLIDGILDTHKNYRFHHGRNQMLDLGKIKEEKKSSDLTRTFYLLEL